MKNKFHNMTVRALINELLNCDMDAEIDCDSDEKEPIGPDDGLRIVGIKANRRFCCFMIEKY